MLSKFMTCAAMAAAAVLAAPAALAQDYPAKPVTLVVGYPAGGPVDTFARALGLRLSEELKQQFVIENKAGANEILAAQYVARAKADGYTLFVSTEAPLTQNQFLYKKLGYSPEADLMPVSQMVKVPMVLATSPNFPANSAKEFIATARSRQGNVINFGSAGVGGVTHLPMAMFAKNEGFKWNHVPYKGAAPILPDLMAGQVDATILAASFLAPYVKDKRIKGLAVSAETRVKSLPDIPTFKELGIKDIKAEFIIGLSAPKGLPMPIAEKLASTARRIIAEPQFREKYMDPFAFTGVGSSPAEFAVYIVTDRGYQEERVKVSGATLD